MAAYAAINNIFLKNKKYILQKQKIRISYKDTLLMAAYAATYNIFLHLFTFKTQFFTIQFGNNHNNFYMI